jgi:hypothetical protein
MEGDSVDSAQVNACSSLENWGQVAQIVIALFTIILAAIAIWGDAIRRRFLPPGLVLSEHNFDGDFNTGRSGKRIIYYHLKVENKKSSPATKVRVLCEAVSRRKADGVTFQTEPLVVPMQLNWSFMNFQELMPTVGPERIVDFGYLVEGSNQFIISLLATPGNFKGQVGANETLRYRIVATADNLTKTSPMFLQVSWDGKFDFDKDEMSKHLVIQKVDSLG